MNKTALVLEGGGFRGVFTAGILEVFLEQKLLFDSVYAVSAGATYGASYVSREPGRNLAVNEYIGDKRYFSFRNYLREGSMFSWKFVLEELPQNLVPFDYDGLKNSSSKFYIGASNCKSGECDFFLINDTEIPDFIPIFTATGSLPLISPIVNFRNNQYLDGGLSDSIPFEYALRNGNNRVVVILTQPHEYIKSPVKFSMLFKFLYRKHPKVYNMLMTRSDRYNASIKQLDLLEKKGDAFVIRPQNTLDVGRVENNPQKTAKVYHEAMVYAESILPELRDWLG